MNNHRRITKWGDVTGWKVGGTACELTEADYVVVEVGAGLEKAQIEIKSNVDYRTRQLEAALDRAFERGDSYARAEIRQVLGIKEPRP